MVDTVISRSVSQTATGSLLQAFPNSKARPVRSSQGVNGKLAYRAGLRLILVSMVIYLRG